MWNLSGSYATTALSWRGWLRAKGLPLSWGLLLANPVTQVRDLGRYSGSWTGAAEPS